MLDFLKNNIVYIVFCALAIVIFSALQVNISSLKKENALLKDEIQLKEKSIDDLSTQNSKLEAIIKEKEKQKQIEDALIEQKQEQEKELNQCKEDFVEKLEDKKETSNEVKDWCEQPLPSDIYDMLYNGVL